MEKQKARMNIIEQAMSRGVTLKEIFRGLLKEYAKLEEKIDFLEREYLRNEEDTACIPEDLSVTEYVSQLEKIRSSLQREIRKLHDFQHGDPHKRVSADSWGKNIVDWIIDYATQLEAVRYLPTVCYLCGRLRVFYDPVKHAVRCEKCGADAEVMNLEHERDVPNLAEAFIDQVESVDWSGISLKLGEGHSSLDAAYNMLKEALDPEAEPAEQEEDVLREVVEYHIAFRDYHQSPYEDKTHPENRKRATRLVEAGLKLSVDAIAALSMDWKGENERRGDILTFIGDFLKTLGTTDGKN